MTTNTPAASEPPAFPRNEVNWWRGAFFLMHDGMQEFEKRLNDALYYWTVDEDAVEEMSDLEYERLRELPKHRQLRSDIKVETIENVLNDVQRVLKSGTVKEANEKIHDREREADHKRRLAERTTAALERENTRLLTLAADLEMEVARLVKVNGGLMTSMAMSVGEELRRYDDYVNDDESN